jgi:hypothetical protein
MIEARPPELSTLLAQHIEAANVLVLAGKIEDGLEKLLLLAGRSISNKLARRIFTGMGPLSSFSGKIEVAYLFNLFDKPVFDDLVIIKDVRNAFAHTTQYVYFSSEHVATKCRNLSTWKTGSDPQNGFYGRALEIADIFGATINRFMLEKALMEEPSVSFDGED